MNKVKTQIEVHCSQKLKSEMLTGGFGGNMSKKSCDFLSSKEVLINVGSTKAIGLVESRGSDKRLVVQEALIFNFMVLNLKGAMV